MTILSGRTQLGSEGDGMAGLIERLRDRDVVTVTVGEWPAATPAVRFSYTSGWRKAITPTGMVVCLGLGVWAVLGGVWQLVMFPALLVLQFLIFYSTSFDWIDRLMGPTVLRAAQALGTETGERTWTVTGAHAHDLAGEVRAWMFYNRPDRVLGADVPPIELERRYIATAGPVLRTYLQPILTAAEHGNEPLMLDESGPDEQRQPGDPWPLLGSAAPEWHQPGTGQPRP